MQLETDLADGRSAGHDQVGKVRIPKAPIALCQALMVACGGTGKYREVSGQDTGRAGGPEPRWVRLKGKGLQWWALRVL